MDAVVPSEGGESLDAIPSGEGASSRYLASDCLLIANRNAALSTLENFIVGFSLVFRFYEKIRLRKTESFF